MKGILSLLLLAIVIMPLHSSNVIIEVSKAYPTTEFGKCKIKMHCLKDAFDYCNKYKGEKEIEIVLKDVVNIIDATLTLKSTKVPITIKAKKGVSKITSGNIITDNVSQRGDTLIFPLESQCWKAIVNGTNVPATTFSTDEPMKQLQGVKKIDDNHYTAKLSSNEILKLEIGCDLFLYARWQCYKLQLTDIDSKTNSVSLTTMGKKAMYALDEGVRYAIYNSRHVMQPGTFCWRDGKVYYLKKKDEDVSKIGFSIPTVATLMHIRECKNVIFKNISFENAILDNWYFQEIQGSALSSKAVHVEYSSNINFINCDFHNNMGYSLAIGNHSSNCTISRCCFTELQGGGIILGMEGGDKTNGIIIDDNLIQGFGRINVCCEGILSQRAHHVTITNNTINDGYYTGINLGWTWGYGESFAYNNYVSNNHIHHLMQGVLDDGGGIYTLGVQNGTVIENNYIHDIYAYKDMVCLIYLDEGTSEITVRNNVCFSSKRGISVSYGNNNFIEGNVIGIVDNWGIRLSYPKKVKNIVFRGNKIFDSSGIDIDNGIPEDSKDSNIVVSEISLPKRRFEIPFLYKEKLLAKKFRYGCVSRRLKNVEKVDDF